LYERMRDRLLREHRIVRPRNTTKVKGSAALLGIALGAVIWSCAAPKRLEPQSAAPIVSAECTSTLVPASPTPLPSATCAPKVASVPSTASVFTPTVGFKDLSAQTYITDVCTYLRERWDPQKSAPGTVVVPIMFHTVFEGLPYRPGDTHIPAEDLARTVEVARQLGYQTVTAEQLAGFLEHNVLIPKRSMIWILDDRHPDMIEKYFAPIARENHWTVTLGWIVGDTGKRPGLWKQMEDLNATGLLDVQSHGYTHLYVRPDTPEALIRQEVFGPIAVTEEHFGHTPLAFVWPGGNFTKVAVGFAREAGYRLGFTARERGPLMYDWIPLGPQEREMQDPLMVLPRFWARPELPEILRKAAELGDEAEQWSLARYAQEADLCRELCGCELPSPGSND